MPEILFPDGETRHFDEAINGLDIALSISKKLAKEALVIKINGKLCDLSTLISDKATITLITKDSDEGLEILRHDCAHVMAEAVKELYPETQVTIGPAIDNGFYYDFAREQAFNEEDFKLIEKRMRVIVARDEPIVREVWTRSKAIAYFREQGEYYKTELVTAIPEGQEISIYRQGAFLDLCRGPHLPSTKRLGIAFKLMKIAGAYWRGDSKNAMLQRIYGTVWATEKQLKAYLFQLEEAKKRDHRKLGQQMDLFHFQDDAPGAVFWHPHGWTLFQKLIGFMRQCQENADYVEINTPDIMDRSLWEKSGHWETFSQNMFTTETEDGRIFAIKPMNCPGGVQVFKQGVTSYRDLPCRLAEFGKVHRYEPSGALHGLMRVRGFTQDDAHIFCTEQQITEECTKICDLVLNIYRAFGFSDIRIKFADRPETRVGSDAVWDASEAALKAAIESTGLAYSYNPGEGAFYGPKLEFVLRDAIGRDWQCGTLQVDLNLPKRLGAQYIGEDNQKHYPVMIHRALFGSLERFTGILIEHYAGNLPLWLAPLQIIVTPIVSALDAYAEDIMLRCKQVGLRVKTDCRNEKIAYKIREHSVKKVPIILVVGQREADENKVTIRRLGSQQQQNLLLADALKLLIEEAVEPILAV